MNEVENITRLMLSAKRKIRQKGYKFNSTKELVEYIGQNKVVLEETGLSNDEIEALKEIVKTNEEVEKHCVPTGSKAKKDEFVRVTLEAIEGIENMTVQDVHNMLYED